jgi:nicotinate-nucleotide adenylyltransferase
MEALRLGLLGGTFDPPHFGHLLAAQETASQLQLEQVLFLPARQNPLKRKAVSSSAEDRCRMVQLAIADNPRFALSRADLDRPPPSYTVDLLRELRREHGPETALYFIVGADILPELPAWVATQEILRLATLVALNRPGAPAPEPRQLESRLPGASERIATLRMPGVDISSSELRERVAEGRPIRYLTPPAVEAYIRQRGLYRAAAAG